MGLFGSRTRTFVDSTSVRVFSNTPNIVRDSVITAILHNRDASTDIRDNFVNGLAVKGEAYYRYGRDAYVFGLPEGFTERAFASTSEIKIIVARDLGVRDVSILSSFVSDGNPEYFIKTHLYSTRQLQTDTTEVLNPPIARNQPVFFNDATIPSPGIVRATYYYDVPVGTDPNTNLPVVRRRYDTEDISVPDAVAGAFFYFVSYLDINPRNGEPSGSEKFWTYNATLDPRGILPAPTEDSIGSPFYPIVPLRLDNTDLLDPDNVSDEQFRTSRILMRRLGVDHRRMREGLNSNPDIGDIDHAWMVVAPQLQEEAQAAKQYWAAYFSDLRRHTTVPSEEFNYWRNGNNPSGDRIPLNSISIREGNFNIRLQFSYITEDMVDGDIRTPLPNGNLPKIGFTTTETIARPAIDLYSEQADPEGGQIVGPDLSVEDSSFIIRQQVSGTQYREIEVRGLQHTNTVQGGRTVVTTLEDSLDSGDEDFWIPLNRNIARGLSTFTHTELMHVSVRMVVNTIQVQRLSWYQTSFFTILFQIVAIVATIYSLGSTAAAIGTAASFTAAVTALVTKIAVNAAFFFAAREIADAFGAEIGALIALAVALYGIGTGASLQGVSLASIGSTINSGVQASLADELEDLLDATAELSEDLEELQEEIRELTERPVDALDLIRRARPNTNPLETPDAFYGRTLANGRLIEASLVTQYRIDATLRLQIPGTPIRLGVRV